MSSYIKKCKVCGEYTLKDHCSRCHAPTVSPHPFRFSPEDRYGRYRRALKKMSSSE
ncbi:MAG: RNA-protein complex protein Nop10 [Thermoplasmata archaeon]|nr:RNA-protein complex protein Nop10 [Thermoplasmata archaeon]